jgi:hypothetical protein
MTLNNLKDIATIIGVVVAFIALIKGLIEYIKQGAQKRADHFLTMRKRLKENDNFKNICALLETDSMALKDVPFKDKRDFLGLFEEVAIGMNSKLIKLSVAHYMFGYYAIRCYESHCFWESVNRDSIYWIVFTDFAYQMKEMEKAFQFNRNKFRF